MENIFIRKDFRTGGGGAKIDIKYAFKIKIGAETFCVFFTEPPHIHLFPANIGGLNLLDKDFNRKESSQTCIVFCHLLSSKD